MSEYSASTGGSEKDSLLDVSDLLVLVQYFDMLHQVGAGPQTAVIFTD